MKNHLKISLFSLFFTGLISLFTACQTESLDTENTSFSGESSQTSERTITSEKLIALKNIYHGTYMSDENGGIVNTNRTKIGAWEKLTLVTWDDGSVSFKGHNGKFLSDENGSHDIRFNRDKAGSWERFNLETDPETDPEYRIEGYFITRASGPTSFGQNYLFLAENSYFGIDHKRVDAAYEIIDL